MKLLIMTNRLLLFLFLLCGLQFNAQTIKSDVYMVGTKISFYPDQCGNAIPEAEGKLTYCDQENNLGVVEKSTGLNGTRVWRMLPNYFNEDEYYVTQNGLSIRNMDGTWENIPKIAIPGYDPSRGSWSYDVIRVGFVLPNGKVLIKTPDRVLRVYDRTSRSFSQINFPDDRDPGVFAYDASKDLTWILAYGQSKKYLYTYNGSTIMYIQELDGLSQLNIQNLQPKLLYHDNNLYVGNASNGLFKIDITDTTTPNVTVQRYNTSTTPSFPFDNISNYQFDANGNLWMSSIDPQGLIKFNIENETYDLYQLAQENNPNYFESIDPFGVDNSGTVWAGADSSGHLYKLTFPNGVETWETTTQADLSTFGVPINSRPEQIYFQNNKFYFLTYDNTGTSNTNYEVIINDNDLWSGRNDNESGNMSHWGNKRFDFALPDAEGGVWWFNATDYNIVHRKANDEQFELIDFNRFRDYGALDSDGKPIVPFVFYKPKGISKIDYPTYYNLLDDSINQVVSGLVSYKDQVWWFNSGTKQLNILKHNQVIATFDLWNDSQNLKYFGVDSTGQAWFMSDNNRNGDVLIRKFDPHTSEIIDHIVDEDIGIRQGIVSGPNGTMWFAGRNGLVYYDGTTFTTYLTSNNDMLHNIRSLAVDANGAAYALLNGPATITKIENAGSENVTFATTIIEGSNSLLPGVEVIQPNILTIDNQGAIWTSDSHHTYKFLFDDAVPGYNLDGETFMLSGLVYNDVNENDSFDPGEAYPRQLVALKVNDEVYTTFTDAEGIYRFYLYAENANYEITLPTIGQYVTTSNRRLLVDVTEDNQSYDGNDFQLKPKFVNTLNVKSSSKTGAWGFERAGFENTFTTAIGNVSSTKTFDNLDLTYTFKNQDENSSNVLPSINDVKVYELAPMESEQLIERITIDTRNNRWAVKGDASSYVQTELTITPELTESGSQTDIKITIPTVKPLNTYIIEINTDLFTPSLTGTSVIHGVSKIASSDFVDNNNVPISEPITLIPLEDRNPEISGFPFELDNTPYINPDDIYEEPPYRDLKPVYSPGPYKTVIRSSYDPNDKLVDEGAPGEINDRHIERKWLTYTIRFENTGNFSAKDIFITDVLDKHLDPNSVKIIETSHDHEVTILKNGADQSILKFNFNDIFLPFDDDNNDGYIKFMVKADENIAENTIVNNVANIYFDQNPPIVTNVIQTRFLTISTLGVDQFEIASQIKVFPNPVSEIVHFETELLIKSIKIYDISGREMMQSNDQTINVSQLNSGTYIIRIDTDKGELGKKLIIQ